MPALDHARLASALLPAVLEAGAIQMRHYRAGVRVEHKSDSSPVTAADRESEAVLMAALRMAVPDIPIVAEEAAAAGRVPTRGERFFLVDPLDGTREFIAQRDEFTVNIALVEQGVPTFGIVYAPACEALYLTRGPHEAVMARAAPQHGGTPLPDLTLETIRTRPPDRNALVALVSRSHATPETEAYLASFKISARVSAGSSLKFCVLARGDADIYPRLGPTMAWDTAAGHAVLAAAGGCVTTLDGQPLRYEANASLNNPHFIAWGSPLPIARTT